jgi:hypothetical protein
MRLSKVLATGVGDGFQGYGLLADYIGSAWSTVRRAAPPPHTAAPPPWTPKVKPSSSSTSFSVYVMKKLRCVKPSA